MKCKCIYYVTKTSLVLACHTRTLGMRSIPVLEKYRYILGFKRYDIIMLLNSVFHTLLLQSTPVGGSASKIAAQPVNVKTEQRDGSNR